MRVLCCASSSVDRFDAPRFLTAVFLAKELEHLGVRGTVTSFDFSAKAVDLARMWSEDCGLMQRINHKHASIEQFTAEHTAEHKEGFDIIMCSGVLHHLPNPLAGLKQLKSMLKPLGVIKLMVYGKYGRAGLKDVREVCVCDVGACRSADGSAGRMPQALRLAIPPNELLTDPERLAELNSYMRSPGLPKTMMLQKNTEMAVRASLPHTHANDGDDDTPTPMMAMTIHPAQVR